ncbi:MAG: hypothetical protein AAB794_01515 [Patescibacteria group bacterium]
MSEGKPKTTSSPEKTKEASERPIEIRDLSMYAQYMIDRTQKVVSEATDEKDRARKRPTAEKFVGIAQMLSTLPSNGGTDDMIASLNQTENVSNQDSDAAGSRKDAVEIKRIEKVLQQIEDTKYFVEHFNLGELKQRGFLEWQSAQGVKSVEKKSEAQKVERAKNDQEIKETELMLKIMAEGSVGLYASLPGGLGGMLDSRRVERAKKDESLFARDMRGFFGLGDRDLKNKYDGAHVREFVALVPAVQDIYNEIEVPVKEKSWGGFSSKTVVEKKKVKVGEQPILHNEAVTNGKNEPLLKLWYAFQSNTDDNGSQDLAYRDDVGRPGNILCIEVLLPESEALKIMAEIKASPAFIRKIVDGVAIKKIGITEEVWRGDNEKAEKYHLRPPYEKVDADSGGKIYIKELGDEYGFNPERIATLKPK